MRIRLELAGHGGFMAKAPIARLDHRPQPGERLPVGVGREHARALDLQ